MTKFSDILGINARHLLFIKKYNPDDAIIFADNKLKTKRFLEARGVPVPKLAGTIRNFNELDNFPLNTLSGQIVIKPNSSSGGEGIIVLGEKNAGGWKKSSGDDISLEQIKRHIHDILSGAYSKNGLGDICLIEKRIISHEKLAAISYKGLPDIRIIVFNMVPVMAMLRLPTILSDGKANMHQGGIGAGIDIAKGEITYLSQFNKIIDEIPGIGDVRGYKIPYWEKILQMAVKTQMITGVGYLGVDIALDRNGPLLLEMNARAGLSIQLANMAPLRKRLNMVEKLKVKSIEKGIRIAKDLFGRQIDRDIEQVSGKTVIGTKEIITLYFKEGPKELLAKINPSILENYIDRQLFEELSEKKPYLLQGDETIRLKYKLTDEKTKSIFKPLDLSDKKYQLILGRRELKSLLIDPFKYKFNEIPYKPAISILLPERTEELENKTLIKKWKDTDLAISKIERSINVKFSLFPLNYSTEMEKFVELSGKYNPHFIYKNDPTIYEQIKDDLDDLHIQTQDFQGHVFSAKRKELLTKLEMFHNIATDAERFTELSEELYIPRDPILFAAAEAEITRKKETLGFLLSKQETYGLEEIQKEILSLFRKYKLNKWNIKVRAHASSRISVSKSKKRVLYLAAGIQIEKHLLSQVLAHEVETHVLRLENALQQPYEIFRNGFANYMETEEGLAIYNQGFKSEQLSLKDFTAAINYVKTYNILNKNFEDAASTYIESRAQAGELTPQVYENIFKSILRVKRGIGDTSHVGGYAKDLVYFSGYKKISDFVESGGNIKNLYFGKISLQSLDDVTFMQELKEPKILPDFY